MMILNFIPLPPAACCCATALDEDYDDEEVERGPKQPQGIVPTLVKDKIKQHQCL